MRIIMMVEVSDNRTSELWSMFEKMTDEGSVDGFFSLCQDGQSLSHELPSFMIHEKGVADILGVLERNFVSSDNSSSEKYKTGEEHLNLEHLEEQRQAWYDHTYGPDFPYDDYED